MIIDPCRKARSRGLARFLTPVLTFPLAVVGLATAAAAQSVPPPSTVVSVCSGVSLPRSVVTDIMTPVVNGIYAPVENRVNGVLGVLSLNPLLNLTGLPAPLSVDVTGLLNSAAAGNNIGLNVIAQDGTLVGPASTCNATADGFMLDSPAGLAIGGNMITGLGASGQQASAGEINSIALGNRAATNGLASGSIAIGPDALIGAGASNSVALGSAASATGANSVALGAGSIAARGPLSGYSAPLLSGTFSSAGEVSIGAPGALRQLTNVAPGSAPTDAATLGQLQALAALVPSDPVTYDGSGRTSITLAGAGGTTITNIAAGTVAAGSSDAVNGSQLYAVGQQVAAVAVTAANSVQYDGAGQTSVTFGGAGGTTLGNVAAGAVSAGSTQAVNGGQLFALSQQVASLAGSAANGVQYDDPTQARVTLGGAAGTVVTNVAAGSIAAGSTDAINGDQLAATNAQVANNTSAITNLSGQVATNTSAITNLTTQVNANSGDITAIQVQIANLTVAGGSPVQYSNAATPTTPNGGLATNDVTIVGGSAGPVTMHNVAAGAVASGSTDAVNGGQLAATNQAVQTAQATANGAQATATQAQNTATQAQGTATQALVMASNSVQYDNAQHSSATLNPGGAAARFSNVATGTAATDAVNVAQLQAVASGAVTSAVNTAVTQANAYTDARLTAMNYDLKQVRREARAGSAAALAAAALPQPLEAGRGMIAGGVGTYGGRSALAIGASYASDNGRSVFRLGVTYDSNERVGANAGVGFEF